MPHPAYPKNDEGLLMGFPPGSHPHLDEHPTPVGESCFACQWSITQEDTGVSMMHYGKGVQERRSYHQGCIVTALQLEAPPQNSGESE